MCLLCAGCQSAIVSPCYGLRADSHLVRRSTVPHSARRHCFPLPAPTTMSMSPSISAGYPLRVFRKVHSECVRLLAVQRCLQQLVEVVILASTY